MRVTAHEITVSEVELAALLGSFSSSLRDLDFMQEHGLLGPYPTREVLAETHRKLRATVAVLADELHQFRADPAQLSLFTDCHHA